MHPILFTLGDFPVHTYGFLGAMGFLVICAIGLYRTHRLGLSTDRVVDVIFWTALVSLASSRALYVLQNLDHFDHWTQWFQIRSGGLVFYGALIPGIPLVAVLIRRYELPFLAMVDAFSTAFPVAHAVTRLGCYYAGCCYGKPTDLPWAIRFDHPLSPAPPEVPLHPTQLYAVGYLLLIGLVVNLFYARRRFDGQVVALYLGLYAIARSINEVFRGDAARGWLLEDQLGQAISTSQALSVVVVIIATAFFFLGARRRQRVEPVADE